MLLLRRKARGTYTTQGLGWTLLLLLLLYMIYCFSIDKIYDLLLIIIIYFCFIFFQWNESSSFAFSMSPAFHPSPRMGICSTCYFPFPGVEASISLVCRQSIRLAFNSSYWSCNNLYTYIYCCLVWCHLMPFAASFHFICSSKPKPRAEINVGAADLGIHHLVGTTSTPFPETSEEDSCCCFYTSDEDEDELVGYWSCVW